MMNILGGRFSAQELVLKGNWIMDFRQYEIEDDAT